MQSKKVSVIIPVYNGEQFIEKTLESIRESVYKNIEIVVVDDGSTDHSFEKVKKIAKIDKRIIILQKRNGGVASARNYGAIKCTGEYITFVDQDDLVVSTMIQSLVKSILETKSEIAICSAGKYFGENDITEYDSYDDGVFDRTNILKKIISPILLGGFETKYNKGVRHYPCIWGMLFLRSFWVANNIKFRSYVSYEDDYLAKIEALSKATSVSTVGETGYLWRSNLESATYSTKYIKDIQSKQQACLKDIMNSLSFITEDDDFLDLITNVLFCKQYIEAIENYSAQNEKSPTKIIQYFDKYIYDEHFNYAIQYKRYARKGYIKLNVLLGLLANKRSLMCYTACKAFKSIVNFQMKHSSLYNFELAIKKRRHSFK